MGEPLAARAVVADVGAAYRAQRVRRALKELRPVLGPRAAVLGDSDAALDRFVVRVLAPSGSGSAPSGPRTVVGAPEAVPLLSGSLTGVLLTHALPAAADRVLSEACRLLQPGGFLLLLTRIGLAAGDDTARSPLRSFDEIACLLRDAGLEPGRRVACHATPSWTADRAERLPRLLWGCVAALEGLAFRWRLAHPVEVTGLLAARKAGGVEVEYLDLQRLMGGWLIPSRWLGRKRDER